MIELVSVSKRYGDKRVVDRVSLRIQKGTLTSLIGPNGAGKSTLLGIMGRLRPIDEGQVYVEGREIRSYTSRELARKVAVLKQANHIGVRLTVRELVSFGRFPYGQGRLEAADWRVVDQAIAYMELDDVQHRYLDQLSGGQQQRAFLAMVIAQDTDYILLDEPLNNLDMKHAVQIMRLLGRLVHEAGKTVVVVLHDINFASCYSDRIVALKDGVVVREGPVEEIIEPGVLKQIYDLDIEVNQLGDRRVCTYYA